MTYDDLKEFDGETYAGMEVGGRHTWRYTDAVWRERKVSPDAWEFVLTSTKRRDRPAPEVSGVPLDTLLKDSRLSDRDVDELGDQIKGAVWKRHRAKRVPGDR